MSKLAVIKTGGKQYLVSEGNEIIVDRLEAKPGAKLELETLATFTPEGKELKLGSPDLKVAAKAQVVEDVRGDKIRVSKFKSKVRFRKVQGFRAALTKLKILKIEN